MSDAGHMTSRIEETHKADWHNYAGAGSLLSCILPILSEFEGVGADLLMGVGGASAASAFVVLMKIGRVTAVVNDLTEEQDEIHAEMDEKELDRKRLKRIRQKDSQYQLDPIGWDESERGYELCELLDNT